MLLILQHSNRTRLDDGQLNIAPIDLTRVSGQGSAMYLRNHFRLTDWTQSFKFIHDCETKTSETIPRRSCRQINTPNLFSQLPAKLPAHVTLYIPVEPAELKHNSLIVILLQIKETESEQLR